MSTRVPFVWVDVFARQPLTGNPLALVPDADGLTTDQMKAVAKEFNQSETTFLVAPNAGGADYRLRSFTPAGAEVLGAGHNAMGAWIWLVASGRLDPARSDFAQQIGDDILPVRIDRSARETPLVTMRQSAPRFLASTDRYDDLEGALGLAAGTLRRDVPTQVVSTGAEHLLVPVRSVGIVDRVVPDSGVLKRLLASVGAEGCYVYALTEDAAPGAPDAYARFFNPTVGIAEDPATVTAAGPLAALLVQGGYIASTADVRIEQGTAIGRQSLLTVRIAGNTVELSGSGVIAAEGTLFL